MDKLLIVDGHNFLFRGYYGVPDTATLPDGTPVNAIYGFFALLRHTVNFVQPNQLLVVFDSETGTQAKKAVQPTYKANRNCVAPTIFDQLGVIRKILDDLKIAQVSSSAHEADDLIGSFARQADSDQTVIGSNDFDFMQLVSRHLQLVRSHHNDYHFFDEQAVLARFGITPAQYIHYLALKGDPSDNIGGVRGIGPKTACKLIHEFGSVEAVFASLEKLPKRLQKLLADEQAKTFDLRQFLTINTTIDVKPLLAKQNFGFAPQRLAQPARFLIQNAS
jgi:DNA polymerase I